jgi:amino acid adenylation domain-containing protein
LNEPDFVTPLDDDEAFFRNMLGDIDEPNAPFGLLAVQGEGSVIGQVTQTLTPRLAQGIREQVRALGVSAASVLHLAWAMVLARAGAQERVVFGTVLSEPMQGGVINTSPLRIDIVDQGARASLIQTHERLAELASHAHVPLALARRCSAVAAGTPLFCAVLDTTCGPTVGGAQSDYPLTLSVDDTAGGFALTARVIGRVDAGRVCAFMCQALAQLVQALAQAPDTPVSHIDVLPPAERAQLLVQWNDTRRAYPRESCIHELFELQARRTPDAPALVHADGSLSYAQLDAQANRLAHRMIALGVEAGDFVALALPRSPELVIAELAVLKCGAAYLPLDPAHPAGRLRFMIEDCCARLVIHGEGVAPADGRVPWIRFDRDQLGGDCAKPDVRRRATDVAYVMYTSGSTGAPKGVLVPHRAISRLVINNGYLEFRTGDSVAFAAQPAFDASTFEVWGPLLNGGRVVVIDQETLLDPQRFVAALRRHSVNVMWLTVGLFNQYARALASILPGLRCMLVGGDVLDPAVIDRVVRDAAPQALVNGYGPTETTTFATTYRIDHVAGNRSIPIGRPIANTRVYILDRQRRPVPVGVRGEIYIGGDGVALGYLNRPELTAERFVPDPFSDVPGARMYKTNDLARYREDGNIEFLGRDDHQVKLRGFRIEVDEIRARLASHYDVADAVVVVREDAPGDKRLVAYCVANGRELDLVALRRHVAQVLPDVMVPAAFVQLRSLPLTPSGKVDRRALPAPDMDACVRRRYEAPEGGIETTLAVLWAELLNVRQVGRRDNFFELGGHSLLAIRLAARMREHGLHAETEALFTSSDLAELATRIDGTSREVAVPPNLIPAMFEEMRF